MVNSLYKKYEKSLKEDYLEYISEQYDYDFTAYLIELLDKNTPIKLDSEYVNDYNGNDEATEANITKYADCPVFKELENDMFDFANEICAEIKKLPYIYDARVKSSKSVGCSTYITVNFKKPDRNDPKYAEIYKNDPKFFTHYDQGFGTGGGYGSEYKLKFRISNHDVKRASDAGVEVNVLGKTFDEFKDYILDVVEKHQEKLTSYLATFIQTGKISNKQLARNKVKKDREAKYNKAYHRRESLNKMIIDESFGTQRLRTLLNPETLDYINMTHTNLETVLELAEEDKELKSLTYIDLLKLVAGCLNAYIIEYTFDETFNEAVFLDDLRNAYEKTYAKSRELITASYKRRKRNNR